MWMTEYPEIWPSESRDSIWFSGIGKMWRKGRAERDISQVKMSPES